MNNEKSKERLLCLIMFIIYTVTMIVSLIVKILFKTQYRVPCLLISVGGILFVLVGLKIKCDEEELKNRAILIYSGVTKMIFVFGAAFENKLFLEEALKRRSDKKEQFKYYYFTYKSPDDPNAFNIVMISTFLLTGLVAVVLYKKDMFS